MDDLFNKNGLLVTGNIGFGKKRYNVNIAAAIDYNVPAGVSFAFGDNMTMSNSLVY